MTYRIIKRSYANTVLYYVEYEKEDGTWEESRWFYPSPSEADAIKYIEEQLIQKTTGAVIAVYRENNT